MRTSLVLALAVPLASSASFLSAQAGARAGPVVDLAAAVRAQPGLDDATGFYGCCRDPQDHWWTTFADPQPENALRVVRLDPSATQVVLLATAGPVLSEPERDIAFDPRRNVLWLATRNELRTIDAATGAVTDVSAGTWLQLPRGLHYDVQGDRLLFASRSPIGEMRFYFPQLGTFVNVGGWNQDTGLAYSPGQGLWSVSYSTIAGAAGVLALLEGTVWHPRLPIETLGLPVPAVRGLDIRERQPGEHIGLAMVCGSDDSAMAYEFRLESLVGSGCNGLLDHGPLVVGSRLEARYVGSADVAVLASSFAPAQLSLPVFPKGCDVYLDPTAALFFPAQIVPPTGIVDLVANLGALPPALRDAAFYCQWIGSVAGNLHVTDARQVAIKP